MSTPPHSPLDLKQIYEARFAGKTKYRQAIWSELCSFFSKWIPADASVLDLGCGYCEFINAVKCGRKFGMDLNPDSKEFASTDVTILEQDCSSEWRMAPGSIDILFTSNFFEHLPTKQALELTLRQAHRALAPGGRILALGPNIKFTAGEYWDYFDHYLPLTERSIAEILMQCGFRIDLCFDRFLPYTMSNSKDYPSWLLRLYLALPIAWRFLGKQFFVVASRI